MNKTEKLNEKKLERLQDLVTSLENSGFYEEAEELQEYLLNPRCTAGYIVDKFQDKLDLIQKYLDVDGTDAVRDEEGNMYDNDLKGLEKITDVEINYVGYKDVVKYDRCYLFFDNVLDRRMVRGEQWLGLSNIERDTGGYGIRPQEYVERRTGVKEKLRWMPRIQEFTLKEYQRLLDKGWIDIDWQEVVDTTNIKVVTRNGKIYSTKMNICPDVNTIKMMIEDESNYGENEGIKQMVKPLVEKEQKEKSEEEKKLDEHENELKMLLMKQKKESEELKRIYAIA